MTLTQMEQMIIELYREVKRHGYGGFEVRVENGQATFVRVRDYKVEKLDDAAD